jgi:ubiquinone/menaquinone biosynthesis C-methylase UbiE
VLTRWDEWYSDDNLRNDQRILTALPSHSAEMAAGEFLRRGKRHILDLACGVGRDTFHLEKRGLSVTGADAALNGARAAIKTKSALEARAQFAVADARHLPFGNGRFDGIYCFGLLHEFTGEHKEADVKAVISEARRVLSDQGIFVLTILAGDPQAGLPAVQLFTRLMFEHLMAGWHILEVQLFDDIGCTNRADYSIWYGLFEK